MDPMTLPSYACALWARHAISLLLKDFMTRTESATMRPTVIYCDIHVDLNQCLPITSDKIWTLLSPLKAWSIDDSSCYYNNYCLLFYKRGFQIL